MDYSDISSEASINMLDVRACNSRNILFYPTLSSTMDIAKGLVEYGISGDTIIFADEQTMGRGRMGRKWISHSGDSILLSFILHPELSELSKLNMIASLSVVQTVRDETGLKSAIKWPNDIIFDGKKIGGVLIENILRSNLVNASIVGIGINTNLKLSSFPEISNIATSLMVESGRKINQFSFLKTLLSNFFNMLSIAKNEGKSVYENWISLVETLGKSVQIKSGDKTENGYAKSIDMNGNLTIIRPDGSLTTLVTGEITLRIDN